MGAVVDPPAERDLGDGTRPLAGIFQVGAAAVPPAVAVFSEEMAEMPCDTPMTYAHDSRPIAVPLPPDREGIVHADIDLGTISLARAFADPVGHYRRVDIRQLAFDPAPKRRAVEIEADGPALVRPEAKPSAPREPEGAETAAAE